MGMGIPEYARQKPEYETNKELKNSDEYAVLSKEKS
jgi:hypothetical protein